jgi:hypothetical protein
MVTFSLWLIIFQIYWILFMYIVVQHFCFRAEGSLNNMYDMYRYLYIKLLM